MGNGALLIAEKRKPTGVLHRHRKKSIAAILFVLSLLLVASDFAIGTVARRMTATSRARVPSAIFHHGLAVNRNVTQTWGSRQYTIVTNSFGFRDSTARQIPLRTDKHRILVLGDSFIEGVGCDYENTIVSRIARAMAEHDVEVLCGAVSSYCPITMWRKADHLIRERGLEVDEVVVFIDLSDIADSTTYALDSNSNVIKRRPLKRCQELIEQNTFVLRWVSQAMYRAYTVRKHHNIRAAGSIAKDAIGGIDPQTLGLNRRQSLWTVDDNVYRAYAEAGLQEATRYMDKIHATMAKREIKLTVAVYPWPDQIARGDRESRHVEHWRSWCRGNGTPLINLFPHFIPAHSNAASQRTEFLREHFIAGDVHWNEEGHALAAAAFLSEFEVADRN